MEVARRLWLGLGNEVTGCGAQGSWASPGPLMNGMELGSVCRARGLGATVACGWVRPVPDVAACGTWGVPLLVSATDEWSWILRQLSRCVSFSELPWACWWAGLRLVGPQG